MLAACQAAGPAATSAPETTAAPAAAEAEDPVSFMVFGDPAELAAYESLVAAYEARYPASEIELIHIPGQGDYRQRLAADFAAGTPSDVVLINYRRYASLAARGALEPLGPYLTRSNMIQPSDFYPEAIEPFRWEGELMCIPQNLSSLVVYYSQAAFDQAGLAYPSDDWTWDEFLQTAQALTEDSDGDGQSDRFGVGVEASLLRVAPFIWQAGGDLVDDPAHPTRLALDTAEARRALQWFADLQVTHRVAPGRVEEEAESSEDRFLNGRLAMFLNSRRGVPTYREVQGFVWDVAALPQDRKRAGILHSDAYCMPASASNQDAIWRFIEFANSAEGQAIVAASGRTVPSLRAVAESPAFLDATARPANSKVFLSTIPYIRGVPVMATWVDIEDTAGEEIERAFYGEATVDEAIQTAISRTAAFFAR